MLDMDSGYDDDIITYGYKWHSLIPFENVLSSRATSPSIWNKIGFLQSNPTDSLSSRAYYYRATLSLASTSVLSLACCLLIDAEYEPSGTQDGFYVDIDE